VVILVSLSVLRVSLERTLPVFSLSVAGSRADVSPAGPLSVAGML
jgi:hypothetical protein